MKRNLQILLIATLLLPMLGTAREETKEERKQRITRKYLREHTTIQQSDAMVPEESPEDLQITDSERFKQPEIDIQRQEPGTMMPPPPQPRRPLPSAEDRNWLLAKDPELTDPYADPFSLQDSTATEPKKSTDWTTWETGRETEPQTESRFDRRNYNADNQQPSGTYDSRRQGLLNPRAPIPFSSDGTQQDSPFTKSSGMSTRSPYTANGLDLSRDKTLTPLINQGRLQTPFPRDTGSSSDRSFGSDSQQRNGSIPYISPIQTQRNQQQQQGTYGTPQQEYQKPDPFKKWKEQNPTKFDPMRDDAFIDELMPKNRR
ncbi:MAG: hypothetical protein K9M54_06425 [Kiritimatiellales bacterium]|nr:hypothetical protein [Kiritimatiellales bacterium]MCF7864165.1 hypothetical protein [Kiritimatiellales bacterium]